MKRFLRALLGGIQHVFYGQKWALWVALRVRNQANMVIARNIVGYGPQGPTGEDWLIEHLGARVKTFIDVGANVGDWTAQVLAHAGPHVRGYLYDASEECVVLLRNRFADSQLNIICKALGDRSCSVTFYEEPGFGSTSSILRPSANREARPITTTMSTLDEEADRHGWDSIDFIKVDCEGYDGRVIAGAKQLLRENRIGYLQFEYQGFWIAARSTLAEVLNTFERYGYRVYLIKPESLQLYVYADYGEFFAYANFLAVRADLLMNLHQEGLIAAESAQGMR